MKKGKKLLFGGFLFVVALFVCVVAFYPDTEQVQDQFTYVEGMEKDCVVCRCSDSFFSNSRCKVTNTGEVCAIGEPGKNIKCNEYKSNCSKVRRMVKCIRSYIK